MTRTSRIPPAAAAVALMLMMTLPLMAENWPQWRGPGSQGISTERALPTEWAPGKNIMWKAELPGSGHSSPIVWNDRLFLTLQIEGEAIPGHRAVKHRQGKEEDWIHPDSVAGDRKHTLKVAALDAKTGKILWEQTAYDGPMYDARHRRSSFAGPTAATDGRMVYAYFGPEGLYAYDFSGKLAWKVVEKFATLGLGTGTSPVLFENLVIIQRDEDNGEQSAVVAFDKATGKEVWKTKRENIEVSWGTPVLVAAPATGSGQAAGGRTQLVTNGSSAIVAYDPATGKELWRTKGVDSNAIHTPLVGKGLVIVTAGFPAKRVIAIRPDAASDDQRIAWEYTKGTGYVLSNILYGDYVYLLTDNGIVTCLDAATGAVKYEGGRPPVPSNFMGSPVAFGEYIAITSEDGQTFMLRAGPKHEVVRTNSVDEPVYSSPAIANGRIYIRGQRHLFAIGP